MTKMNSKGKKSSRNGHGSKVGAKNIKKRLNRKLKPTTSWRIKANPRTEFGLRKIASLRANVDLQTEKIIEAVLRRKQFTDQIMSVKQALGLSQTDKRREDQILKIFLKKVRKEDQKAIELLIRTLFKIAKMR